MILWLIVLVSIICLASAGPVDWDNSKCSHSCPEGSTKYQFRPGTSYMFSYESENELQSERASELVTKLAAKVEITTLSKCEMVLELLNVVSDSDKFTSLLERNPLPFSWSDGKITHVCPQPLDTDEVLNVKKAILSSIQNTMRSFEMRTDNVDVDIFGTCDTAYNTTVIKPGKYQILKTINIPSCSNYLHGQTPLLISLYQSSSNRQHLPLLSDEKATCEQLIENGLIHEVQCHEEAYFKPLFDYGHVVRATGRSTLKKISVSLSVDSTYKTTRKESLVFKYRPHSLKKLQAEEEIQNVLHHICKNSEKIISKEVASYMHKLVYTIRQMDAESIERIYDRLKNKEFCKSGNKVLTFYVDALRQASSGGSIALLSKLLTSGQLSEIDSIIWVTLMPFTSYVEEESISSLIPLLRKDVANTQTLLGTTALAYKYCSINPECESTLAIKDFSAALKEFLGDKCSTKIQEEETQVITALKAFGNLGFFSERAYDLLDCALNATNKMALRIAAIDAFRRSNCKDHTTSKFLEVYSNKSEHDELRIAALMPVTKCASKEIMQKILDVYFSEISKQVEVFTWSLLENIRTSQDPSKSVLRKYLGAIDQSVYKMKKPVSTDLRKFSRNFDTSFFSSFFNLGIEREANLIHSADSFIPRSGNIVHKLNVFGHHVETMEIGARVEDLEHSLEKLFGPVAKTRFSNSIFDELLKQIEWIKQIPTNLIRSKRSDDKAQGNSSSENIGYQRSKLPHGTAFLRIMGHELGLLQLNKEFFRRLAEIKAEDMFKNLENLTAIDTTKNFLFLDFVILSPSITGRAYKLASNHSITVSMSAEGRIDINMNSPIPDVDIDGKCQLSVLSEMSTSFTIHGDSYYEPGIQVETILNGGSDYRVILQLKDGRLMHLKLTPEQKLSEILNLKQTFYFMSSMGKTEIQKRPLQNLNYCTEFLQNITGAQICASLMYAGAFEEGKFIIPFSREFEASIVVEQTDSSMDGYELLLEIPDFGNSKERRLKFLADTPSSVQNRKFSLEFQGEIPDANSHSLTVDLYTPFYTLNATGYMMNGDDDFRLITDMTSNDQRRYSLIVHVAKLIKGDGQLEYQPVITLSSPSLESIEFRATIVYSRRRKAYLSLNLVSRSFSAPFIISGNLEKEGEMIYLNSNWKLMYEFNVTALSKIHRFHAGIGYDVSTGMFFGGAHQYGPHGLSYESVTYNAEVKNIKLSEHLSFSLNAQMLFAEHKNLNTMMKWDFSFKSLDHLKNDIVVKYGENFKDDSILLRLTFINVLHGDFNSFKKFRFEKKVGITSSYLNIDKSASLLAVWDSIDEPKFIIKAVIKCENYIHTEVDFGHWQLEKSPLKLATNLTFTFNTYNLKYTDETVEISPKTFKWSSTLEPLKDNKIITEIGIKYQDKFQLQLLGKIQIHDIDDGVRYTRRIALSGIATPGDTNTIDFSVKWGRGNHETITVQVTSRDENDEGVGEYIIGGYLKYDGISIDISGSINTDLIKGPHNFRLTSSEFEKPKGIEITHEIRGGLMKTATRYFIENKDRLKQELTGKLIYRENSYLDINGNYILISHKRFRFNGTSLSFRLSTSSDDEAIQIRSNYEIKIPSVKECEGKFHYKKERGWSGIIKSFFYVSVYKNKKYVGKIYIEPGMGKYFCNVSLTPTEENKFNLLTSFLHGPRFAVFNYSLDTNFSILQTIDLQAKVDLWNLKDAKTHSYMYLNSHKLYEVKSSFKIINITDFDIQASIHSKITPSLVMFSISQESSGQFECNLSIDSKDIITGKGKFKIRREGLGFSMESTFKYKEEQIIVLRILHDVKNVHEKRYFIKTTLSSQVYSLYIKVDKEKAGINNYDMKFCRNKELCIRVKATHKEYDNTNEWNIDYKRGDVAFIVESIRESSKSVQRYHTVIYKDDKRFGYDIMFGVEGPGKIISLGIVLPNREIVIKGKAEFSRTKPKLELTFSTDGRNHPERKLCIGAKFEKHLMNSGLSKFDVSIALPTFQKPIEFKLICNVQSLSSKYFTAEGSLDYSIDAADKIIAKLSVEDVSGITNMIFLNIYLKDDRPQNLVLKVNSTFKPNETMATVKCKWIDEDGAEVEIDVIVSHLKTENQVSFVYHTPFLSYKLDGKIKPPESLLNNTYEVDLQSVYDGMLSKGKLVLNYDTGYYKLVVSNNGGETSRIVVLCINFYSRKKLSLYSEGIDDNGKRTLEYLFDIVKIDGEYTAFRHQINSEFYKSRWLELTSFADKVGGKIKTFIRNFNSKVSYPFTQFLITEAKEVAKDIKIVEEIVKQATEHNYSNMPSYETVKEYATKVKNRIKQIPKDIWDNITSYFNEKCQNDKHCTVLVRSHEDGDWKGVLTAMWKFLKSLPDKIQHNLRNRGKDVGNNPRSTLNDLLDWLSNLMIEVLESSKTFLQPLVHVAENLVPSYYNLIEQKITTNEFIQTSIKLLKKGNQMIKKGIERIVNEKIIIYLRKHAEDYWYKIISSSKLIRVHQYDAEKGLLDVDICDGMISDSLKLLSMGRNSLLTLTKKSAEDGHKYNRSTLTTLKRILELDFIPPYDAQAVILGNQHFITFDMAFYDFAGDCSYLLTKDFQDGNFTVVLKPKERNQTASIVVQTGDTSVEISSTRATVRVSDDDVELPYLTHHISVTREGNMTVVRTKNGFQVKCNLVREICIFRISGWYYGKTAGLLGTYNYEKHDELQRPINKGLTISEVNSTSWGFGKSCGTPNLDVESSAQIDENSEHFKICKSYFALQSSPLSACFKDVAPEKYFNLCVRYTSSKSEHLKALCNVAAAYVSECERNYLEQNLPPECSTDPDTVFDLKTLNKGI